MSACAGPVTYGTNQGCILSDWSLLFSISFSRAHEESKSQMTIIWSNVFAHDSFVWGLVSPESFVTCIYDHRNLAKNFNSSVHFKSLCGHRPNKAVLGVDLAKVTSPVVAPNTEFPFILITRY